MRRAIALLIVTVSMLGTAPCFADKRVALVIGNAAYRNMPQLINPKNDAEDVSQSLRALGFETVVATDLDRGGMNQALGRFARMVEGAEIALVYYSGHGMQFGGSNYLLPIEARLDSAGDVNRFQLLPADDVLEALRPARGARVLVLDACRNNPVEEDLKRRLASVPGANRDAMLTRGLSRTSASNGLLIAYSTQANDVANDGTARNSPFTAAFLKHVGAPDIDLPQMLFRVSDEVDRATRGRQRPELSYSMVGEFKLKPATLSQARSGLSGVSQAAAEAAQAWAAAKDTTSIAVLEEFARRYADGFYTALAHARIEELRKNNLASAPPVQVQQATPVAVVARPAEVAAPPKPSAGRLIREFAGHSRSVYSVAFSPDGRQILSGSLDDTLRQWEVKSGTQTLEFKGHAGSVRSVAFAPDGRGALAGGTDKVLHLWDATSGASIRVFKGHSDYIRSVAFARSGQYVLSGSDDKTMRLWDATSGAMIREFKGHSRWVTSVAFSPDGRHVLSGCEDKTARLWDVSSGASIRDFTGHSASVRSVAFSPDGRHIVTGSLDKTLRVWDALSGAQIRELTGHSDAIYAVAFSPDGRRIASGSKDNTIRLWDAGSGALIAEFKGHAGPVNSVAFSPDGR
jgi:uncharacterized caspase-like protein/tricorn protease-like protein